MAMKEDPPFARLLEAGDHPQGRRLPGSRWSEHAEELAVGDLEVDPVNCGDVAESLDDAFQAQGGLRSLRRLSGSAVQARLDRHSHLIHRERGLPTVKPASSHAGMGSAALSCARFADVNLPALRFPASGASIGAGFVSRRPLRARFRRTIDARAAVGSQSCPRSACSPACSVRSASAPATSSVPSAARRAGALIVVAGAHGDRARRAPGRRRRSCGPRCPGPDAIAIGLAAGVAGVAGLGALYRGMAIGCMGLVTLTGRRRIAGPAADGRRAARRDHHAGPAARRGLRRWGRRCRQRRLDR